MTLSADMLYWLASTVAQSVVAILAFAAFIGIWRRDALWAAVESRLGDLAYICGTLPTQDIVVGESVGEATRLHEFRVNTHLIASEASWLLEESREWLSEYWSAADPDRKLGAVAAASGLWIDFEWPEGMQGEAEETLDTVRSLGGQVRSAHQLRDRIRVWLVQLVRSGISTFVLSLLVIWRAEAMQAPNPVDWFLFLIFVLSTGITIAAASVLASACFQEIAVLEPPPGP